MHHPHKRPSSSGVVSLGGGGGCAKCRDLRKERQKRKCTAEIPRRHPPSPSRPPPPLLRDPPLAFFDKKNHAPPPPLLAPSPSPEQKKIKNIRNVHRVRFVDFVGVVRGFRDIRFELQTRIVSVSWDIVGHLQGSTRHLPGKLQKKSEKGFPGQKRLEKESKMTIFQVFFSGVRLVFDSFATFFSSILTGPGNPFSDFFSEFARERPL